MLLHTPNVLRPCSAKLNSERRNSIPVLILASLLFLWSCEEAEVGEPSGNVIAEVGQAKLTLEEATAKIHPSRLHLDSADAVQEYRSQWVRDQLFADEAKRLGIHESESFREAMEQFERQLLVQMLFDQYKQREGTPEVSRDQALRYYERHRDQFVLPERHVRFRHMISSSFANSNNARTQLLRGVPWPDLVDRYSVRPEYSHREASRFQPLSTALEDLPEMAQFLGVIGVSEVSPIRLIDGEYHFVQLVENQAEGTVPELDWTLEQIKKWIAVEQQRSRINAYKQNLIRQAEANRQIRLYD